MAAAETHGYVSGTGAGYHMQEAIPLRGLPVGRTWKHGFAVKEMVASFLEVSVYLCHTQPQVWPAHDIQLFNFEK